MEQKRTSWRTQTVSEGKQNTRKPTGWQYQWPLALVVMFAAIILAQLPEKKRKEKAENTETTQI